MGTRAARTNSVDTRYFAYDENHHLIGEYSPTAGAIQETIYLGDMPVAIAAGGNTYFVHADYRNTPLQIDNAAGKAVWDWDPLAFGDNAENDNPLGLSEDFSYAQRFPGQYYDSESGLHYNLARFYQPATGRYSQSDPIGMDGGINTYAYVGGNPLTRVDPRGLYWTCVWYGLYVVCGNDPAPVPVLPGYAPWQPGGPITGITGLDACLYDFIMCVRGQSDPVSGLKPFNPGKDCNGKCKPCPPNEVWSADGDAHGSTGGTHNHGIVWNQDPTTCTCYPKRVSGPDPMNLK